MWRDEYTAVLSIFYEVFYIIDDKGTLGPLNQLFLELLHYVYLKLVKKRLNVWQEAWSKHRIRTTKMLPLHLWFWGQLQNLFDVDISPESLEFYSGERNVEYDFIQDERDHLFHLWWNFWRRSSLEFACRNTLEWFSSKSWHWWLYCSCATNHIVKR